MDSKIGNLNGKILNPLIDFDFIVNTEMGLIRLIREQYPDDRAFNLEILNKSDREILSLLYSRENPNPLSIISTEENMDHIDSLYLSFFKEKKSEIIQRSTSESSIISFVNMMIVNGTNFGVNGAIAIEDDIEAASIASHFSRINTIYKDSMAEILIRDPFYIRDYRFFTEHGMLNLSGKKIYMMPRTYNINYFETEDNNLTNRNVFILTGTDYRLKGENENG